MTNLKEIRKTLSEEGISVIRDFFPKKRIRNVLKSTKEIFKIQFAHNKYKKSKNESEYLKNMVRLFERDFEAFQNCGKILQSGMYELYDLAYDAKLKDLLINLGLEKPLVCTRPVLFFNHQKLAKKNQYYKTPRHQDYPSMLASKDSLVVWIPLVDVDTKNGAVIFYPGSHKNGAMRIGVNESGFAECQKPENISPIQPELKQGDIAIFSTFLVHESGDISNNTIRWSCHFRYTNMLDQDFISRGFPSPYIYKSVAGADKT